MADDLRVVAGNQVLQCVREATVGVDQQVPHVVVRPAAAALHLARAPHEALQQRGQQRGGVGDQTLDELGVPPEELVCAVVVPLTVRADGQEVPDDSVRGLEAAGLDGPGQRRDGVRADLHDHQPLGPLAPGGAAHSLLQLLRGVHVDGLHDDGGALVDGPDQDLRDQREGPPEGFHCFGVAACCSDSLYGGCHKGREELRRYPIANVSQPQCGNVINLLPRVSEDVQRKAHQLRADEVQAAGRLLEVVLPRGRCGEEALVHLRNDVRLLALIQTDQKVIQGALPRQGAA
mmetsp:Transcript_117381/g.343761  ORF Transcript_117381/g.343761 Transcript_117381/m.343761 type:complete len:290 (-) Transcript_117381:71-940(-)